MKYRPINITFKGTKTIKEIYTIHISDLKQSIHMVNDVVSLNKIEDELKQCLAITYNKRVVLQGGKLAQANPEPKFEIY